MPNSAAVIEKGTVIVQRLKKQALALIGDFWKDPAVEFPVFELKLAGRTFKIPNLLKPIPQGPQTSTPVTNPVTGAAAPRQKWHALPGELAEKMWGEGNILPSGNAINDMLVKPLGLTREKLVLDLTAGLGGAARKLLSQVNQIKGLEADAAVAARGMELSVAANKGKLAPIESYDPKHFSMPAVYHCMIARELFYRTPDMGKFFYSIVAGIKEHGQIVFTDYIVDSENRAKPAIAAWIAYEKEARPLGLIEMAEAWAREGVEIRTSEDQTDLYRREIVDGINRFVSALRIAPPPDAETKKAILHQVETWIHRLAAIQQGMKFYRFHAVKS